MKKTLSILFVILLTLSIFAGCQQAEPVETEEPVVEESQEIEATEEATEEPQELEEVTIQLYHGKREAQEVFSEIIGLFSEQYPNITVEQETVTTDATAVLKARVATGEIPDIMSIGTDVMELADADYLVNLTGEDFLDNISSEALNTSTFTDGDGQTWALPMDGSFIGVFYNKTIFNEYDLEVPRTISELTAVCETLKENGVPAFALAFKDAWTIKMASISIFSPAVYANDRNWDIKKSAGEVSFADSQGWKTSLEQLQVVYEYGNTDTAFDTDYNGSAAMFAEGKAAMIAQGLWALEPIRAVETDLGITDLEVGVMGMPVSEDPDDAKLHQFPDFSLSISSDSENIDSCKKFLAFLTTKEIGELWSNKTKLFSPVLGVAADFDPIVADVAILIEEGRISPQGDRGWPAPFHPAFEKLLPEYLLGQIDIDEALASLDAEWATAIEAAGE